MSNESFGTHSVNLQGVLGDPSQSVASLPALSKDAAAQTARRRQIMNHNFDVEIKLDWPQLKYFETHRKKFRERKEQASQEKLNQQREQHRAMLRRQTKVKELRMFFSGASEEKLEQSIGRIQEGQKQGKADSQVHGEVVGALIKEKTLYSRSNIVDCEQVFAINRLYDRNHSSLDI